MPRQIDLFTQNLQVNHNPNNRLSFSSQQVTAMQNQLPTLINQAEQESITKILELIDSETGLDLVGLQTWLNQLQASIQQSWLSFQNLLNGLAQETDADVTAALQWLGQQFQTLNAALQQGWLSFQNLINGIVQETDADVAAAVTYIQNIGLAANNAYTQIQNFLETGDWSDLSMAWAELSQAIFGSVSTAGLLGTVPSTAVTNVTQSLQPVFDFPNAASISGGDGWSWDGTVDHTGVAGSGSAKVVLDGTLKTLNGIPSAVQVGQVVTPQAWVQWSGLVGSGSPIQLQLVPYGINSAGQPGTAGTAVTIGSAGGASGSWTKLSGSYTVPSSGVSFVQMSLVVTTAATGGTVWWDDCSNDVTGGFLADLQNDTTNIIDSFAPGGTSAEFLTGVTNLLALFGLTPSDIGGATVINTVWTDVITDIINPLNAIETQAANIIGSIEQSAVNGLTQVWDWLTGTTTPTSSTQVLSTSVASSLSGSSLSGDITSVHSIATSASSAASAAQSTANTNATNLGTTWTALYGSSSAPTSTMQVSAGAVPGLQGITTGNTAMQNLWDNAANAIANVFGWTVSGSGNSLSTLSNVLQSHAQATQSALTLGTSASNAISAMSTSQPLSMGISDQLIASTMSIFDIFSSAISALNINAGNSVMGFIQFPMAATIGSVSFLASSTSSGLLPSSLYCNIYSVNSSTGAMSLLTASSNISGSVAVNSASGASKGAGWLIYNLTSSISVTAGELLAIELVIPSGGSGVLNIYGQTAPVPLYSAVYPQGVGAQRSTASLGTSPSSITASGVTFITSAPWIGVDGPAATPYYFPVTTQFTSSTTYSVPAWAGHLDVIALGAGGGGGNGFAAAGSSGTATTVVCGSNSLTAAAGSGGSSGTSTSSSYAYGSAAGVDVYNGATYHGGTSVSPQYSGSSPGGGGGGGVNYGAATYGQGGFAGSFNTATWTGVAGSTVTITIGSGGTPGSGGFGAANGASGAVWLVARQ